MSTPNAGTSASPAPQNIGYPFLQSPNNPTGAMNFLPPNHQHPQQQQQQQHFMSTIDMSTASPIPGASGGQGDPGPSSLAQQQQQQQQGQGHFRPNFQQGGITPQQMQMLQQFSQAAQNQNGGVGGAIQNRQLTPQQMQVAMATMQAQQQGGQMNPQALMAAMRANQQGQGMQGGVGQQGQQQQQQQQQFQRPPNQQQMSNFNAMLQQPVGTPGTPNQQQPNPAQIAFQQQRLQQVMQQGMPVRPNPGSPVRPHQQQQSGSMPPPPIPGPQQQQQQQQLQGSLNPQQTPNSNGPQQMGNASQTNLTPQQQQFLINQRNALLSNPQFLAMPLQQQQAYIASQQQQFLRMMANNQLQGQAQQPQQSQQQPMQQAQTPGRPSSSHGTPGPAQSPIITRQGTPQQMSTPQAQQMGTPQSAHVHTPQQPLSSLPQHMNPPRPTSAASQRAPSPHQTIHGMPGSPAVMQPSQTPPPPGTMYPSSGSQPMSAPSPTHSNVSHHSQNHTPAPPSMSQPPHSSPPIHGRSQTPSQPQQTGTPQSGHAVSQVGINGQYQGNQQYQQQQMLQQQQQHQQNMGTPQQSAQPFPHVSQGGNQNGPSNSPMPQGAFTVQPIVPTLQNMTPAQQQQMASAMGFMSQAAQAQQTPAFGDGSQNVKPNQQGHGASSRKSSTGTQMPNIDTSDFPFDPRLLPMIQHLNNADWRANVQAQNPQLLVAVQSANSIFHTLRPDVVQRMQNYLFHSAKVQAAQQAVRPPSQGQIPGQQPQSSGVPGFSPNMGQAGTPGAIPPNQQQRIWQAQQAAQAQGSPASVSSSSPSVRPPPPHLPPASNMPGSPSPRNVSLDRRTSGSGKDKSGKDKTPQQASMPPPNFIPTHSVGPPRPPPYIPSEATSAPQPNTLVSAPILGHGSRLPSHGLPVKEWEDALRLDLPITNITHLPINEIDESEDPTFKGALPPMTKYETNQVKQWLEKDKQFITFERENQGKRMAKMKKWAEENDKSTPWWMLRKGETRNLPSQRLRILWPAEKDKDRAERTHKGRKQIKFSPAQLKSMAEVEDHIVPVRLDLEHDSYKLKDTFMWNCADKVVTPEIFAQSMCDDFAVPPQHFLSKIVTAIQERVQEYQDQVLPIIQRRPKEDNRGKLNSEGDSDTLAMIEIFRKVREGSILEEEIKTDPGMEENRDEEIKIVSLDDINGEESNHDDDLNRDEALIVEEKPMTVEEAMQNLPKEEMEELRILIKVDIIIGTQNLSDSFEWDLNSTVSPEEFAISYVTELGLSKEFATALAHDIHEQILVHKRSLFLVGHSFGSGLILDDEVRLAFLAPVTIPLRKEDLAMSLYTPIFNELREDQLAVIEAQREKESKRKKRAGRARRGIVLPDRDPIKTQRSLLNPLGPNGLPVFSAPELASTKDSAPLHRRRGAAIAAEANMALIAQDLPLTGPPSPAHNHHGPTISAKGKRIGRPPKNLSRASPASFRENSASIHDIHPSHPNHQSFLNTPSMSHIGIKRSFREDSMDDFNSTTHSPIPSSQGRKRINHSRIPDSPETDIQTATHTPIKENNGTTPLPSINEIAVEKKREFVDHDQHDVDDKPQIKDGIALSNWQTSLSSSSSRQMQSGTPTLTSPIKQTGHDKLKSHSGHDSSDSSDQDDDDEDEDDDDDNESDSTFASSRGKNNKRKKSFESGSQRSNNKQQGQGRNDTQTPARSSVVPPGKSPIVGISPGSGLGKKSIEIPQWASKALSDMKSKYPRDDFAIVQKPRPADHVNDLVEWRAKCIDCPGRIYSLGPGETLQNFEVHLKNRAHIANRLTREGKTH
ncbi:uncharacterized protein IL334_007506 [Kwoniella shivajii]|uniref:SWI/SNF chromatin-remodeling complex subunit snf5 n=1 Tax=Kwoniella shivajii TaxID=564305 RepID=A0ABZ1D8V1_9TREE|nr:hypothetical protein IL334_007506 [Kwoniella shivajii]